MKDYATLVREEARLIVLRQLAAEPDLTSNSSMLQAVLETYGVNRTRDWLHAELRALEERGALKVAVQTSVMIVTLTQRGLDHVERRLVLDGVKRPSAETV